MVKKVILYALIGIVSIIILALIVLPFVLPSILENNSKDWIGRSVGLEKMRVNYFTGTVRLYNFDLFEKDDSTVFVGFDTLLIDTEPYRLFSKTFVIEQFYLQGLFVDVIMYDSAFNFDDLTQLGNDSTSVPEEEPPDDSEPLKFEFSDMELRDAVFIVQDAEIQDSIEIDDFDFFLPHLVWNQQEDSEADLRFDFKNEGYFEATADYNPGSNNFAFDFILGNYDISGYQAFAAKYFNVGKFEGIIDLGLNLTGNAEQLEQTSASGKFTLSDFALYDDKDSVMIGSQQLTINVDEVNYADKKILIDSVLIARPSVYFEAYDSTSNIAQYIERVMPAEDTLQQEEVKVVTVSDEEEPEEPMVNEDSTQQFFVQVSNFLLERGVVRMADYNQERSFEYQISEIHVSADSITTQTEWMNADLSMRLSDRGKMEGEFLVDLSNPQDMTLDFTISSLMLEDFDVYCREATGFPLIYGDMYFKSHMDIRDDTLKSQNNIVIHNMKLGKRRNPIGPPLKFAMFLLKDKDKVVHIDMPVEGPVGDSGTDIGKMFWDTFSGLLGKVASTPFKFIGAVLNVFDTDIKHVKYDYLDSAFTNQKQRQMNTLLKIEDLDEELKIDLIYYKDSLLERQQIAMDLIAAEFGGKENRRNYNQRLRRYVEKRINTDTLSLEEACLRLADKSLVDSVSAAYDSARFSSLRNYLHEQRDTTSISFYHSRAAAPNNEDRKPRFEVKLGMKDDFIEDKYVDEPDAKEPEN